MFDLKKLAFSYIRKDFLGGAGEGRGTKLKSDGKGRGNLKKSMSPGVPGGMGSEQFDQRIILDKNFSNLWTRQIKSEFETNFSHKIFFSSKILSVSFLKYLKIGYKLIDWFRN